MPQASQQFYEGQEFENPDDPKAPILVWTKKRGFIQKDAYDAMMGGGQAAFDDNRAIMSRLDKALAMSNKWDATGALGKIEAGKAGGALSGIGGTAGYNLDRTLLPVRANNFIRALSQMRQNSPTGGAVGNVTEGEGAKLESTDGVLDIGQSREQLQDEIRTMRQAYGRHFRGLEADNPLDLSDGQPRSHIPLGAYYTDPQGNVRRNDNGDRGNPIIRAAPRAAAPAPAAPAADGGYKVLRVR